MQLPAQPTLIGMGLYTPAEAGRLLGITASRITRWLRGHTIEDTHYPPLWEPQLDLGEDGLFLGFRDLQEVRVAAAFIGQGLSAQRVRRAIDLGRETIGDQHPLSTARFRTDGRSVFLQVVEASGEAHLLDLFKKQFAFRDVLERSLDNLDYDSAGIPKRWWPLGKAAAIVLDPQRSFGQPIEDESSVPVDVLAAAAAAEGTPERAALVWDVPVRSVTRALAFEAAMASRRAA